jgi:hypothetical protein
VQLKRGHSGRGDIRPTPSPPLPPHKDTLLFVAEVHSMNTSRYCGQAGKVHSISAVFLVITRCPRHIPGMYLVRRNDFTGLRTSTRCVCVCVCGLVGPGCSTWTSGPQR